MDDAQRKDIAKARFLALRNNIPRGWDGTAVSYYHSVLAALEEAFGMNFSPFRIGEGHMKPVTAYFRLRARPGRPEAPIPISKLQYCSEDFARQQLEGAYLYLQQIELQDRPSATPPAGPLRKKRGRPTLIPDERKLKALEVKSWRERAKILYNTNYPTLQQVKNAPSILRHFQRARQKPE